MNEKDAMSRYLKPSAASKILAMILAIMFIAAVAGAMIASKQPQPEAARMQKNSGSGRYAYIDVQLMACILEVTGRNNIVYYEVLDTDGNSFMVSLGDKQYEQYTEIVEYTTKLISGQPESTMPAPVRLYGVVTTYPSAHAQHMAETYEGPGDFGETYGNTYLDAKRTPESDLFSMCVAFACIFGFFAAIMVADVITVTVTRNKARRRLEETGELEKAEMEFVREDNLVFEKQGVTLSENFMYCKRPGVVIPYRDIAWIYYQNMRVFFIPMGRILGVATLSGRIVQPTGLRHITDEFLNRVSETVAAKNNDVLLGLNIDNQKEFRARVKAAKETRG